MIITDGVEYTIMEDTVTATELARNLGDVLARVRYRRESFVVAKNGRPVARVVPVASSPMGTLKDVIDVWTRTPVDDEFADVLERVGRADAPPENPWGS